MYYDYLDAVRDDVKDWVEENIDLADYSDSDELKDYLNDTLWTEDSVTGNGSGSYTFDRSKAGEYLAQNFDLLYDAIQDFGGDCSILKDGPEACDVTIRCYLLGQAVDEVVDELWEDRDTNEEN